ITDHAGLDPPRPAGNHRHADAALVHRSLEAAQRPGTLEKRWIAAAFLVWSIVAAEEDQRLLVQSQVLKPAQHLPDVAVEAGDHGRMVLLRLRPGAIRIGLIAGHFHAGLARLVIGVRDGVGQVEEEWLLLAAVKEG